jgi:hypothetical protein
MDCRLKPSGWMKQMADFQVQLPQTPEFYKTNLTEARRGEVEKAEK